MSTRNLVAVSIKHSEFRLEDFSNKYSDSPWIKFDSPDSMCMDFCKKYREYDTVLVSIDQYIKYYERAGLPLSSSKKT